MMIAEREHWTAPHPQVRTRWPNMIVGGPLTDKRIDYYEKRGYYSEEVREGRRELRELRRKRQELKRTGNFLTTTEGRQIYSPI